MPTSVNLAVLLVFLLLTEIAGLQLDCGPGGEASEGSDHTLTCDGIQSGQTVHWIKKDDLFGDISIANCTALTCQTSFTSRYDITRPDSATSSLKIRDVSRDKTYIEGEWKCVSGPRSSFCYVSTVYPPDIGECEVGFDEAISNVTGRCEIHRVYPKPTCLWYEQFQGHETFIPSRQSSVTLTQYVHASNSQIYFRATCGLKRPLPVTPGVYSYKVLIIPKLVSPRVTFTTTSRIAYPTAPTLRNCPQDYVKKTDINVTTCMCVTSDLGSPQGSLAWYDPSNNTILRNSSLVLALQFTDVTSEFSAETYRCEVIHHTRSPGVNYVPKVPVRPNKPTLTVTADSGAAEYEVDNVINLRCSADGGKPAVNQVFLACPGHPDLPDTREAGEVVSSLSFRLQESDEGAVCVCFATNDYESTENVTRVLSFKDRPTSDAEEDSGSRGWIAAVVVMVVLLVVVCAVVFFGCWIKQRQQEPRHERLAEEQYHSCHAPPQSDESQGDGAGCQDQLSTRPPTGPRQTPCAWGTEENNSEENDTRYTEFPTSPPSGVEPEHVYSEIKPRVESAGTARHDRDQNPYSLPHINGTEKTGNPAGFGAGDVRAESDERGMQSVQHQEHLHHKQQEQQLQQHHQQKQSQYQHQLLQQQHQLEPNIHRKIAFAEKDGTERDPDRTSTPVEPFTPGNPSQAMLHGSETERTLRPAGDEAVEENNERVISSAPYQERMHEQVQPQQHQLQQHQHQHQQEQQQQQLEHIPGQTAFAEKDASSLAESDPNRTITLAVPFTSAYETDLLSNDDETEHRPAGNDTLEESDERGVPSARHQEGLYDLEHEQQPQQPDLQQQRQDPQQQHEHYNHQQQQHPPHISVFAERDSGTEHANTDVCYAPPNVPGTDRDNQISGDEGTDVSATPPGSQTQARNSSTLSTYI